MILWRMIWESPWFWLLRVFYLWPLHFCGCVHMLGWHEGVELYGVAANTWYARLWRNWAGFAGPEFILINEMHTDTPGRMAHTLAHEMEHIRQWRKWGLVFPILYLLELARKGYHDNRFEMAARLAANNAWLKRQEQRYG